MAQKRKQTSEQLNTPKAKKSPNKRNAMLINYNSLQMVQYGMRFIKFFESFF